MQLYTGRCKTSFIKTNASLLGWYIEKFNTVPATAGEVTIYFRILEMLVWWSLRWWSISHLNALDDRFRCLMIFLSDFHLPEASCLTTIERANNNNITKIYCARHEAIRIIAPYVRLLPPMITKRPFTYAISDQTMFNCQFCQEISQSKFAPQQTAITLHFHLIDHNRWHNRPKRPASKTMTMALGKYYIYVRGNTEATANDDKHKAKCGVIL